VFWCWGDTLRSSYPLGLFRMAGAVTPVPEGDLSEGVAYKYFTGKDGFARAMMPLALIMAAMFSTSIYFTFRDSFVATPPDDSTGSAEDAHNINDNPGDAS
jgi:hypothetical protein